MMFIVIQVTIWTIVLHIFHKYTFKTCPKFQANLNSSELLQHDQTGAQLISAHLNFASSNS